MVTEEVKKDKFKDFKNFVKTTIKDSYWVLIKYVLITIYLTVSSIVANTLNLDKLTYYNAIISLIYVGDMLAFAVSNGIQIYVEQYFEDKKVVEKYIKCGLLYTFILVVLLALVFVIFKDFFIYNILGLEGAVDLNFYYLMVAGYVIVSGVIKYLEDMLLSLKCLKTQIVTVLVQCLIIVISMLLILWCKGLTLVNIAIINLVAMTVTLIMCLVIFKIHKNINMNLFKPTNILIGWKNTKTLFLVGAKEVFWEIGYLFTSLFLLKINEKIFDAYSYYENVLDIANSIYFSFVAIASLTITRSIGRGDKELAYKQSKYTLWVSLIIWVIYFALSMALSPLIIMGLNPELKSIGFISLILYVALYLPKFISWALNTYILDSGGQAKALSIWEFLGAVFIVLLYIFGDKILDNIYLIYSLLIIQELVKLGVYFIVFKRKKWLTKVEVF